MNFTKCISLAALSAVSLNFALSGLAQAAPITTNGGRAHALSRTKRSSNDITGGKANLTGGWNHLLPGPLPTVNPADNAVFLNKDMWIVLDKTGSQPISDGCWLEVMVKNGNYGSNSGVEPPFIPGYKGYTIAKQVSTTVPGNNNMVFTRYAYGTNPGAASQTGGSLEIVKAAAPGTWEVKVNGSTALTIPNVACREYTGGLSNLQNVLYTPTGGSRIDWGIESNDTTSTFTNGTSMAVQYKLGTQGYVVPSNTVVYDGSTNTFGWTATYNNGTVTINR
jgi:hypothetical protein